MSTERETRRVALALGVLCTAAAPALARAASTRPPSERTGATAALRQVRRAALEGAAFQQGLSPAALADPGARTAPPEAPIALAVAWSQSARASTFFPPGDLGRGGAPGQRAAPTPAPPTSGAVRLEEGPRSLQGGPALTAVPLGAPTEGGGPRTGGAVVLEPSQVLSVDGQDAAPGRVVLPLGCQRIVAVGTPAVRALALRVEAPDGARMQGQRAARGQRAVTLCARDAGTYQLRLRMDAGPEGAGVGAARVLFE
jgi:hypothetical protein